MAPIASTIAIVLTFTGHILLRRPLTAPVVRTSRELASFAPQLQQVPGGSSSPSCPARASATDSRGVRVAPHFLTAAWAVARQGWSTLSRHLPWGKRSWTGTSARPASLRCILDTSERGVGGRPPREGVKVVGAGPWDQGRSPVVMSGLQDAPAGTRGVPVALSCRGLIISEWGDAGPRGGEDGSSAT